MATCTSNANGNWTGDTTWIVSAIGGTIAGADAGAPDNFVLSGGGTIGTLTPKTPPSWTANTLIGRRVSLGAAGWFTISANTTTTLTIIVSPPQVELIHGLLVVLQLIMTPLLLLLIIMF